MENMSGAVIWSEHVLLALLEWDTSVSPPRSAAMLDLDGHVKRVHSPYSFRWIDSVDEELFSATGFCRA